MVPAITIVQVVLIGSRAKGAARQDSDLDLVAVVEPPPLDPPWGNDRIAVAKRYLQHRSPLPAVWTDLSVRTIDQMADAGDVFGTVEWMVGRDGVIIHSLAPSRAPRMPRAREEIIAETTAGWLSDSVHKIHAALKRPSARPANSDYARSYEWRAIQHAVLAAFVLHQVPISTKDDPWPDVLRRLCGLLPSQAARIVAGSTARAPTTQDAIEVVRTMMAVLSEVRRVRCLLRPAIRALDVAERSQHGLRGVQFRDATV